MRDLTGFLPSGTSDSPLAPSLRGNLNSEITKRKTRSTKQTTKSMLLYFMQAETKAKHCLGQPQLAVCMLDDSVFSPLHTSQGITAKVLWVLIWGSQTNFDDEQANLQILCE